MTRLTVSAFVLASWPWLLAFVLLIVSMFVVWQWVRSTLRDNADDSGAATEMLLHCREMLEEGELSPEEFRLIRSRLGGGGPSLSPRPQDEVADEHGQ